MKTVSISEFYSNFNKYINIILKGENIILSENKRQVAVIEPIQNTNKRPIGLCKGEFVIPENFNEQLPDDYIDTFYK